MNKEARNDSQIWDAKRLIREYTHVAWILNDSIPFERINFPNQIKLKRIASVICAFLNIKNKHIDVIGLINSVFAYVDNREVLDESPMSKEDITLLMNGLSELKGFESLMNNVNDFSELFREQLFWMVLRYRVQADDLQSTFSNVHECNIGGSIAVALCNYIYNPQLDICNEQLDSLLALLLGNSFHGKFSTSELVEKYNYPTTTDDELIDFLVDNF